MTVSVAVGNRRLLKLAERLETIPPKQFRYTQWVGDDWRGAANLSCGTQACALGWATTIPSLRRVGLHLQKRSDGMCVVLNNSPYQADTLYQSLDAAERVFGLDPTDAWILFIPASNENRATAKQVAKKIRKFVSRRTRSLEPSAPSK